MDTTLLDKLRPLLSRVIAAALTWLIRTTCARLGVPMLDGVVDPATDFAVNLIIYAIAHRLLDKKLNPGDAASATLAKAEKAERAALG